MREHEAERRLVKSAPELWAQCSDPEALGRHLTRFGEIRITRLEPESTVAWEGESVSGTVELEASGWGTRVRLTARPPASASAVNAASAPATPADQPVEASAPAPSPAPAALGAPGRLGALIGSILSRRRDTTAPRPAPSLTPPPAPRAASVPEDLASELEAALDSLGQAHHRPYSRA